ncbi:sensor histidine kinase [Streptomyces gilvus]|uniref:sensor histidine kinase n=1 Tax=Streptomyces gilvus TaxID=2920937 RepID=UPI001F0FB239|nr:histidine kinase [Streptomyces sp. CME 23]MCH5670876.1 histidine kinase [Streptomyces sp. CME 23]
MSATVNPRRVPSLTRSEILVPLAVLVVQSVLAAVLDGSNGTRPDAVGFLLLTSGALLLAWRQRAPMGTTLAVVAVLAVYHTADYNHLAAVPASLVALYALALCGPQWRTYTTVAAAIGLMVGIMLAKSHSNTAWDILRNGGWILAVVVIGDAVRIHRQYVAAIVQRAERAERTREEEAARRVAEERMRIARDLHDLLAHSITLVGVQASVAAHVLVEDPELLDRQGLAKALQTISDTCREARAELRTTLRVLRDDEPDGEREPVPGLDGLPALARAAEAAGALVGLDYTAPPQVPAPVGVAAYRIVQEALTNAVRHAPGCRVRVRLIADARRLRVTVEDDGPRLGRVSADTTSTMGYGLVGMRERARSVAGTLTAGPSPHGRGFAVEAELPFSQGLEAGG